MKIAVNYKGDLIVRDTENKLHLFTNEEFERIGSAYYQWVQKRKQQCGVYL